MAPNAQRAAERHEVSRTEVAAAVLELSGLGAILRRARPWRGVLILNYHRLRDEHGWARDRDVVDTSPAGFDAQLRFLSRTFEVLAPEDLNGGVPRTASPAVLLTFDDGYRDGYEVALPLLSAYGIRAIYFVTTGFVDGTHAAWWDEVAWMVHASDRPGLEADGWVPSDLSLDEQSRAATIRALLARYLGLPGHRTEAFLDHLAAVTGSGRRDLAMGREDWMTWDMARALQQAGMTVAAHSVSHPVLSALVRADQRLEIEASLTRVEQELGHCDLFAYPVGERSSFGKDVKALLRDNGVRLAFSNYGGVAAGGEDADPYDVPRTPVGPGSLRRFRAIATLPEVHASLRAGLARSAGAAGD
jgi:peptidoglycan/xylan/chitin deacetylase (PgdA/CDA1 family)